MLNANQLAELLGVSRRTIQLWEKSGKVPEPIRIGRTVRWRREEIEAWLKAGSPNRLKWKVMKK